MNPYSIPPLMSGFLVLILGFYVFLNKRKAALNVIFLAITIAVSIWLVSYSVAFSCLAPRRALFWSRIGYLGVTVIPVLTFHFHIEFIKKKPIKLLMIPLYCLSLLFFGLAQTDYFLKEPKLFFWGYYPQAAVLYPFFLCFFLPVLWAGPVMCINEVLKEHHDTTLSPLQIQQLKYVVVAFLIASFGAVDFIPKFGIELYPFAYLTILTWLVIVSFAISQYRLMDIDMAAEMVQTAKLAAIGMLSAGINHEIRNPLYVIKGQSQTFIANVKEGLYQSSDDAIDDALRIMAKVEEQANRASDIIKKLSQFARPRSGHSREEVIDLPEVLANVLELIQYEIEFNKIQVRQNIDPNLPLIQIDRRQLEEILFNLILNACQEMALSGGVLTLSSRQRGDRVRVVVEDTGRGISKDKLEYIFDPFFTTKQLGKGTGLGLYLTRQLVEKNKGKIWVESEENQGTTAILEFLSYVREEMQIAYS